MSTPTTTANAATVVFAAVQSLLTAVVRPLAGVPAALRALAQDIDPNNPPQIGMM